MQPFGGGFGGFDRKSVCVERFGVLVVALELVEVSRCLLADSDNLEWQDIDVARFRRANVVSETEPLASDHAREMESRDLAE